MVTSELNTMCKDCDSLNKNCDGTKEQVWTGCVCKGIIGRRVKITNPYFNNRTGIVKHYLYNTGDYIIIMDDDKKPSIFRKSEFEVILEET